MQANRLFSSFFMGGFECSTQYNRNRLRVDVLKSTGHDRYVASDYAYLKQLGVTTVREGLRWHLIEQRLGRYDFSSVLPTMRAAKEAGMQVIWDICHYGWPDFVDIYRPEFVRRFAGLAAAFTKLLNSETDEQPYLSPINEISFFAWAGGDAAYFNPFSHERGLELKIQLVRAAMEGIEAIWAIRPDARICHIDPIINVAPRSSRRSTIIAAHNVHLSQFEAWDMLAGMQYPGLGGDPKYLDILGVNYYYDNQWTHPGGKRVYRGDPLYRPFRSILREAYGRYKRPMFIAETGIEGDARPEWLAYIGEEARAAMRSGVDLNGVCLYPILNHPGWDDSRHCHNGLLDYREDTGAREIYEPLAQEIRRQAAMFGEMLPSPAHPQAESGYQAEGLFATAGRA